MSTLSHLNPFPGGVNSTVTNISGDKLAIASTNLGENEKRDPFVK